MCAVAIMCIIGCLGLPETMNVDLSDKIKDGKMEMKAIKEHNIKRYFKDIVIRLLYWSITCYISFFFEILLCKLFQHILECLRG